MAADTPSTAAQDNLKPLGIEPQTAATYTRLSAAMRLVACFVAMHMSFVFDIAAQRASISMLRTILVLSFSIYVVVLYWLTVHDRSRIEHPVYYWIDCFFYLAITMATGGPSSHFYFFLSFPLLFMSLRKGFQLGMLMTIGVCTTLLLTNIFFWRRTGGNILSTNILLGPSVLLALGYMMSIWANTDLTLNRRLAALKGFGGLFNPRYSIEQTIDRVVRRVAEIYPVEKYVLLLLDRVASPRVFRADLPQTMYAASDTTAAELAAIMATVDGDTSMIYTGKRGLLAAQVHTTHDDDRTHEDVLNAAEAMAKRLNCTSFCALGLPLRLGGIGWLVMWADEHQFRASDLPFFSQLAEQITPRMENVQLLDRLSAQAAETEREKISRDVHDSAIQPYIGLKFALEGLARKVTVDSPLAADVARLVDMASEEIQHMRTFIKDLRGDGDPGHAALVPALRRQAARFAELYGIRVEVTSPEDIHLSDALGNEVFHMVSAALANVRRHTMATYAQIQLAADDKGFTLSVSNPCDPAAGKLFTPRSIAERAQTLGGTCEVSMDRKGMTTVTVHLPKQAQGSPEIR